jgi:hypothetical protein
MRNRRSPRRFSTLNRRFSKTSRMLKTVSSFVLGSSKSSTYPRGYASSFDSPAALPEVRFEHPVRLVSASGPQLRSQSAHSLRPLLGQGASRCARVGRVRILTVLSILCEALGAQTILKTPKHRPLTPYDYLVSSFTRWPSSGRMSFSIASLTAFSEPGVEKRTRPLMIPAVARLMMAGEPIS